MSRQKSVKFWMCHKGASGAVGAVRLSVTVDKELRWSSGGPTDEGYQVEHSLVRISDCGECVEFHWRSEGRDCDGPFTFGVKSVFRIDDERILDEESGLMFPRWMNEEEYQQDCFAIEAGY